MEISSYKHSEWVEPDFVAINSSNENSQEEMWTEFDSSLEHDYSIAPYLLTQTSSEQSNQSTQYSGLSPSDIYPRFVREAASSMEKPVDGTFWLQMQSNSFQQYQQASPRYQNTQPQLTTGRDASTKLVDNQVETNNPRPQPDTNPQPVKRKRGRPRLTEAQNVDSSPLQLSSARKSHLEKNRVAAEKCRQRRKEYTVGLIAHASDLSSKNKALKADQAMLREQVLNLKNEVLRHAGCGSWAIDKYVERCAGNLLGVEAPSIPTSTPGESTKMQCRNLSTTISEELASKTVTESFFRQGSTDLSTDSDEYDSLRLLGEYEKIGNL
jgi:hypothetical protein